MSEVGHKLSLVGQTQRNMPKPSFIDGGAARHAFVEIDLVHGWADEGFHAVPRNP